MLFVNALQSFSKKETGSRCAAMKYNLLPPLLALLNTGICHIVVKNNCNYKDNDLTSQYASSPYECGTTCANTPRCTHFTWVPTSWTGSPHCWMKHADTEAEILTSHETAKDPKAFCGHLDFLFENGAFSQFEILKNCDYKDNDLYNELQDYVEGCASRCYENPSCTHFTWDLVTWRSRPICYLKYSSSKDDALATRVAKLNGAMCGFVREGRFGVATTVAGQGSSTGGVPEGTETEPTPPDTGVTDGTDSIDLASITIVTPEDLPRNGDASFVQP